MANKISRFCCWCGKIEPLEYRPAVEYSSLQEVIVELDTRIRILNEKINEIIDILNSRKDKKGGEE